MSREVHSVTTSGDGRKTIIAFGVEVFEELFLVRVKVFQPGETPSWML